MQAGYGTLWGHGCCQTSGESPCLIAKCKYVRPSAKLPTLWVASFFDGFVCGCNPKPWLRNSFHFSGSDNTQCNIQQLLQLWFQATCISIGDHRSDVATFPLFRNCVELASSSIIFVSLSASMYRGSCSAPHSNPSLLLTKSAICDVQNSLLPFPWRYKHDPCGDLLSDQLRQASPLRPALIIFGIKAVRVLSLKSWMYVYPSPNSGCTRGVLTCSLVERVSVYQICQLSASA